MMLGVYAWVLYHLSTGEYTFIAIVLNRCSKRQYNLNAYYLKET